MLWVEDGVELPLNVELRVSVGDCVVLLVCASLALSVTLGDGVPVSLGVEVNVELSDVLSFGVLEIVPACVLLAEQT